MKVKDLKNLIKNMDDDASITFYKAVVGELKIYDAVPNNRENGMVIKLAAADSLKNAALILKSGGE